MGPSYTTAPASAPEDDVFASSDDGSDDGGGAAARENGAPGALNLAVAATSDGTRLLKDPAAKPKALKVYGSKAKGVKKDRGADRAKQNNAKNKTTATCASEGGSAEFPPRVLSSVAPASPVIAPSTGGPSLESTATPAAKRSTGQVPRRGCCAHTRTPSMWTPHLHARAGIAGSFQGEHPRASS